MFSMTGNMAMSLSIPAQKAWCRPTTVCTIMHHAVAALLLFFDTATDYFFLKTENMWGWYLFKNMNVKRVVRVRNLYSGCQLVVRGWCLCGSGGCGFEWGDMQWLHICESVASGAACPLDVLSVCLSVSMCVCAISRVTGGHPLTNSTQEPSFISSLPHL